MSEIPVLYVSPEWLEQHDQPYGVHFALVTVRPGRSITRKVTSDEVDQTTQEIREGEE
jgi:hypothetical protein